MKIQHACLSCATAMMFLHIASGQGFVNLNFEQATIAPTPVGEYGPLFADPQLTFPGWTIGNSTNGLTYVLYNNETLGSPAVDLMGPNFPNGPGYNPDHWENSA